MIIKIEFLSGDFVMHAKDWQNVMEIFFILCERYVSFLTLYEDFFDENNTCSRIDRAMSLLEWNEGWWKNFY